MVAYDHGSPGIDVYGDLPWRAGLEGLPCDHGVARILDELAQVNARARVEVMGEDVDDAAKVDAEALAAHALTPNAWSPGYQRSRIHSLQNLLPFRASSCLVTWIDFARSSAPRGSPVPNSSRALPAAAKTSRSLGEPVSASSSTASMTGPRSASGAASPRGAPSREGGRTPSRLLQLTRGGERAPGQLGGRPALRRTSTATRWRL